MLDYTGNAGGVRALADVLALLRGRSGHSMFYSKICNYVHLHALNAEVVGKRGRVNDLAVQKYKR